MENVHVLAIRILAFSTRFGQLVPMDSSRMEPISIFECYVTAKKREAVLAFVKIRIRQLSANLFDGLNVIQVRRSLR